VLENSPATEAGIEIADVITAIDGVPADRLTLAAINEMFEKAVGYTVTIQRGDRTITVKLTPARLI
jgi:C-terminal processing protease CtpA/Prc